MKKLFLQFTTLLLISLYLSVTVGFSIYECRCKKQRDVIVGVAALRGDNECCCKAKDVESHNSCGKEDIALSCCKDNEPQTSLYTHIHAEDACQADSSNCCSVLFSSLNEKYNIPEIITTPNNISVEIIPALAVQSLSYTTNNDLDEDESLIIFPPPDRYVKTLHIYHNCQLRL